MKNFIKFALYGVLATSIYAQISPEGEQLVDSYHTLKWVMVILYVMCGWHGWTVLKDSFAMLRHDKMISNDHGEWWP